MPVENNRWYKQDEIKEQKLLGFFSTSVQSFLHEIQKKF